MDGTGKDAVIELSSWVVKADSCLVVETQEERLGGLAWGVVCAREIELGTEATPSDMLDGTGKMEDPFDDRPNTPDKVIVGHRENMISPNVKT